MTQNGQRQLAHIFFGDVIAPVQKCTGFGGKIQEHRRAHTGTEIDIAFNYVGGNVFTRPRGSNKIDRISIYLIGNRNLPNQPLKANDLLRSGNRCHFRKINSCREPVNDRKFFITIKIVE